MGVLKSPGNSMGLPSEVCKFCPCSLLIVGRLLGSVLFELSDDGSVVSIVSYYLLNDLSFVFFVGIVQLVSV